MNERREKIFFFLKIEFRVLPCEKVTLNAKRVNSGASHPPLNFANVAPEFVAHRRLCVKAIVKSYTFKSTSSWTHEYLYTD